MVDNPEASSLSIDSSIYKGPPLDKQGKDKLDEVLTRSKTGQSSIDFSPGKNNIPIEIASSTLLSSGDNVAFKHAFERRNTQASEKHTPEISLKMSEALKASRLPPLTSAYDSIILGRDRKVAAGSNKFPELKLVDENSRKHVKTSETFSISRLFSGMEILDRGDGSSQVRNSIRPASKSNNGNDGVKVNFENREAMQVQKDSQAPSHAHEDQREYWRDYWKDYWKEYYSKESSDGRRSDSPSYSRDDRERRQDSPSNTKYGPRDERTRDRSDSRGLMPEGWNYKDYTRSDDRRDYNSDSDRYLPPEWRGGRWREARNEKQPNTRDGYRPSNNSSDGRVVSYKYGDTRIVSEPTITVSKIEEVLRQYNSPAQGLGQKIFDLGVQHNINPALALAFFIKESSAGTKGWAVRTKNWGNRKGVGPAGQVGPFMKYNSFEDSLKDWFPYIHRRYVSQGLDTLPRLIHTYAPNSDGNNEAGYVRAVMNMMRKWSS